MNTDSSGKAGKCKCCLDFKGVCVSFGGMSSGDSIGGCAHSLSLGATVTNIGCSGKDARCSERGFADCPSGIVIARVATSNSRGVDLSMDMRPSGGEKSTIGKVNSDDCGES